MFSFFLIIKQADIFFPLFSSWYFQDASEKIVTVKSNSVLKRIADRDSMDNESLLSTSSNLEPFASDDLGKKTELYTYEKRHNHAKNTIDFAYHDHPCFAGLGLGLDWILSYSPWILLCFALSLSLYFLSAHPGNTVIHLDKALARMREYERMKLRAECNTDKPEHSPGAAAAAAASALTQGIPVITLTAE